ncbi:hypothetical protein ABT160_02290 [Streptomyces sp. NPDC001941]|uniref:hypothetical protein n=1 Tax=Streptomyces sp. NPDC001941 TaxID=3154659 RepID=UPI003325DB0C
MFGQVGRAGARTVAHALAVVVAAGALTLSGPGTPRADAASVCSGRPAKTVTFATGELRVYKNRTHACALTIAKKPGARRAMSVSLQPRGGRPVVDSGKFVQQAGPVTAYALNRCVRASGSIAGAKVSTGWILCR